MFNYSYNCIIVLSFNMILSNIYTHKSKSIPLSFWAQRLSEGQHDSDEQALGPILWDLASVTSIQLPPGHAKPQLWWSVDLPLIML